MSESSGRTTVSVSANGSEVLAKLKVLGYFETELAAFLAVSSLAVSLGLEPLDLGPGAATKWNRGSGDIQVWLEIVPHLVEIADPVKALERFGEAGLLRVGPQVERGLSFIEIFASDATPTE